MQYPNFRLWWVSSSIITVNQLMSQLAMIVLVLDMTDDSPQWSGLVVFSFAIPAFFLTLPSGVLADRWDKRKQLLTAQAATLANALVLATLAGLDVLTPAMTLPFAAVAGAMNSMSQPARQSLIPQLVPPEHRMNGIVLGSLSMNLSQLVGPAIAAAIIASASVSACLYFLCALLVVGLLSLLKLEIPKNADGPKRKVDLAELIGGFTFLASRRDLLVLMILYSATGFWIVGPLQALVPVLIRDYYHAGDSGLGFAYTVQAIGAIISALWITRQAGMRNKGTFFGFSMVLGGLALAGYGASPTYAIALVSFFAFGCATAFYTNMSQTILMTHSPPETLGRVLSITTLSIQGLLPLGAIQGGVIAGVFDARIAVLYGGLTGMTLAITALISFKDFRKLS